MRHFNFSSHKVAKSLGIALAQITRATLTCHALVAEVASHGPLSVSSATRTLARDLLWDLGPLWSMSESAATIKLFFRSMVAPDCSCEYTTSGRSGG